MLSIGKRILHYKQVGVTFQFFLLLCVAFPYFQCFFHISITDETLKSFHQVFVISMTILIAVLMERIMAGIAAVSFYWMLLLIMEKMISFEVNHVFANFMPLRLSGSRDFYIHNEIYRFAGKTLDAMIWCPAVAMVLSAFMVGIAIWCLQRKTVGVKNT